MRLKVNIKLVLRVCFQIWINLS